MTTTATTVGYGDFAPSSWHGRLLSIFYMPAGTVIIMGGLRASVGYGLSRLDRLNALLMAKSRDGVSACVAAWRQCMAACGARPRPARSRSARGAQQHADEQQSFTLRTLFRKRRGLEVGPFGAYLHALLLPIMILIVWCVLTSIVKGTGFIDSLYYGVVTMTTVGYGDSDLLPTSFGEKAYTIIFMLFSTTALAVCVERLQVLRTSRLVYLKDFREELPHMMLLEAIKERNATPTIVEDEFVLHVLEDYGVVSSELIHHIRNDFKRIEGFGISREANDGEIEVDTLFEHLVARGQILDSNRVAPGTTCDERNKTRKRSATRGSLAEDGHAADIPESVVDMSAPDKGFAEWLREVWTPFLQEDPEYAEAIAAPHKRRSQIGTPNGSVHGGPAMASERSTPSFKAPQPQEFSSPFDA